MIFIAGLIIACFLLVLLFLKKRKRRADYILTCWIGLIILQLSLFYINHTGIDFRFPHLLGIMLPLPVLNGVFLYLYTIALTEDKSLKTPKLLLHLIPFMALIILAIPFYSLPAEEKVKVFQNEGEGFEWYTIIQLSTILISGFSYSIASIWLIRKHRKHIINYQSNTDRKMLTWLELLSIGMGMIWFLVLFFDDEIIYTGVVVFVLFIGFFGISQVPVFNTFESEEKLPETKPTEEFITEIQALASKYAKSGLEEDDLSGIMLKLEQVMLTEKPFTDCDLTLNDLANKIKIHPNKLSQVINSQTGNSFYHYVNIYRVKEFLMLSALPENKKYTFLSLAYDCGFNSKTTFNKYFKIYTGKTPSELLQQ